MAALSLSDFVDAPGITSRVHRVAGADQAWGSPLGVRVDLPLIVDIAEILADHRAPTWWVEARIELRNQRPAVTQMALNSPTDGLDLDLLQETFRWRSPLEVVTRLVPQMIKEGTDPYTVNLPIDGFPQVTLPVRNEGRRLSEDFLEDIARQYLELGRGYSRVLAAEYHVSERTVKSWVTKARERGLLTPGQTGSAGGSLIKSS